MLNFFRSKSKLQDRYSYIPVQASVCHSLTSKKLMEYIWLLTHPSYKSVNVVLCIPFTGLFLNSGNVCISSHNCMYSHQYSVWSRITNFYLSQEWIELLVTKNAMVKYLWNIKQTYKGESLKTKTISQTRKTIRWDIYV